LVGVQVNAESELPVLRQLEAYFKGRLERYPTTMEQDKDLVSPSLVFFSLFYILIDTFSSSLKSSGLRYTHTTRRQGAFVDTCGVLSFPCGVGVFMFSFFFFPAGGGVSEPEEAGGDAAGVDREKRF